ncbi:hypothetical protein BC831DRAFT_440965 [Entophlyctis helioformis]|nr:hypothetical protein BC831DRAFT_440965 [Entophlyctis helioformis]
MLFALDKDGVPSVAKTIRLQLGPATAVPVPSPKPNNNTPNAAVTIVSAHSILASVATVLLPLLLIH